MYSKVYKTYVQFSKLINSKHACKHQQVQEVELCLCPFLITAASLGAEVTRILIFLLIAPLHHNLIT